jgi:PAS domain S-box-containing protein
MESNTRDRVNPAGTLSVLSVSTAGPGPDLDALFDGASTLLALLDVPDLRITRVNASFRAACGHRELVGRTWRDAFPRGADIEARLRRAISHRSVQHLRGQRTDALQDAPVASSHDRFVDLMLQPLIDAHDRVTTVFVQGLDVTDAHRGERQDLFLRALEGDLRELRSADAIATGAATRLRTFLGVQGVLQVEVDADQDRFTVIGESGLAHASLMNRQLRMGDFGPGAVRAMHAGAPWVIDDVSLDPGLDAHAKALLGDLGARSLVWVPMARTRRWVAALAVLHDEPRAWNGSEIELVEAVSGRSLESIERARLERAAHDNEDRYRALLRGFANIFWTAGPDGFVTEDSPSWRAFTGQTQAQWLGMGWLDALHPEDRHVMETTWPKAASAGKPIETEYRLRHVDGGWRWTSVRAVPIAHADGSIRQWVGMHTDITGRKLAERRDAFLVRLDDATRPLTEPDGIARTVLRLLCEELGADRATYFEIDADGHAGNVLADHAPNLCPLQGIYPLEEYGADFARAVRAGDMYLLEDVSTAQISESERRRFDAIQIVAELMVPLHKAGALKATLGIFQGRPRVWQPEEIQLCNLVVQRCWDSLERARIEREVRQADRRKDEFIATLSHELRNPLAPIRNGLSLLQQDGAPVAPPRLHAMMQRQVDHLVRMVDDLLDVSRINRGMIELQSTEVSLQAALRNAIETARPGIEAARHELDVRMPDETVWVRGDAMRLTQVFANLLNNAAKYTADHGRLRVTLRTDDAQAVIDVEDNGIGIPSTMLIEIFETFAQTPEGRLRGRGGLGIGLSLVRRLVALHGGHASAHSDGPGCGSRFEVRLPRLIAAHPSARTTAAAPSTGVRRGRVLVVDDNRDAADSICEVLRMDGWECVVAYDGRSALAWIEDTTVDLALLDLGMPEMDGYQLARRIRQSGHDRVVLVALTGWGQAQDRALSQQAGFDRHLVKPVDPDTLSRVLGEALGAR